VTPPTARPAEDVPAPAVKAVPLPASDPSLARSPE
jgi:hypothetical protein